MSKGAYMQIVIIIGSDFVVDGGVSKKMVYP